MKKTVTEIKNAFDEIISRLDMAKERTCKLKNNVSRNFLN